MVVFTISNGEYTTNNQSSEYQSLKDLISKRNVLAHQKPFFEEYDVEIDQDTEGMHSVTLGAKVIEKVEKSPLMMTDEEAKKIRRALRVLRGVTCGGDESDDIGYADTKFCEKIV